MLTDRWSSAWKGRVVECWSPSGWKRLVHPLAWQPDSPALPIRPLPLLEEVLDHPIRPDHQNVSVSFEMTPPPRHLLGCHWPCHQLWPGRHLLPNRPLWPGHCLWLSRHLWSGRCLWPCCCVLPGRHPWPSRRLLPGQHLPSRPLPVPGLELLGPIQHESAGPARQPP